MKIPFQNFTGSYEELKEELDKAYQRFMRSGWYVLGTEVKAFEQEYADFCEAEHCVGVGHGLDALMLALRACDVGEGDEVIVPSNTYIATWLAVSQVGAKVVPVEPDPNTFNVDPAKIAASITTETKVILPVNLYGHPCDYDAIMNIAHDNKCKVVIDNAQAHGAKYKGRRVGGIADVECHSFYPSKNLGALGEAGAITTNDQAIAERIETLRNYGSRVRYYNDEKGFNSRLDELQAAFLRVKLRKLDEWTDRRRHVATRYLESLKNIEGITLPQTNDDADHVWHLFVIRSLERHKLQEVLDSSGIQTLIHYPVPPHLSDAYREMAMGVGSFPIAEKLADEVISLPMGPFMDDASVDAVIKSFQL
ncbi:DegT/DnrJ/EryC1/StrS family aminotransferase [Akkermansiaceae bacterium]|nr:DegT/DnrJ/EryC1/StrS family aminotransferase [Akkermansiaceae bacterium]